VASGASDVCGRIAEVRVAVEATPRPQADEYLARAPIEPSLQLDGIVAGVEDEQGGGLPGLLLSESAQQSSDLLGSDRVRLLARTDALDVHGGGPTLAGEVQPGYELVGPSGDDGLTGGMAGRVVVEAALGTTLGIAAVPHAHVHGVHGRFASGEWMADKQVAQGFDVDPSPPERGVEAAPAPSMRRLEAQVSGRRDGGLRGEDGIGQLEEGVGSAVEAIVERAAEGAKSVGRFHDVPIMPPPTACRILPLPAGLKRKLRF